MNRALAATGVLVAGAAIVALFGYWSRKTQPEKPPQSVSPPHEAPAVQARLIRAEGPVFVHLAGHEEGRFVTAEPVLPLDRQDIIRTGPRGRAEIALQGESLVELGPESYFIVESLQADHQSFYFRLGTLVARLTVRLGSRIEFHTPSAVAAVRGTELALTRRAEDPVTRVAVFRRGQVSVRTPSGAEVLDLGPNQEVAVGLSGLPERAQSLEVLRPLESRIELLAMREATVRQEWARQTPEAGAAQRQKTLAAPPADTEPPAHSKDSLEELRNQMRKEVRKKMRRDKRR